MLNRQPKSRSYFTPDIAAAEGKQLGRFQCRKWRTPVNTMANPERSAASMTS